MDSSPSVPTFLPPWERKSLESVFILRFLQLLLSSELNTIVRPQLLLLDELGYLPVDKRSADLTFQVVAALCEAGSIVVSTNRIFIR